MNKPINHSDADSASQQQQRLELLKQYGDFTLAYGLHAQDSILKYFHTELGYIAYARKWGYTFALGDPVAEKSSWPKLVDSFIKQFRRPCFIQASEDLAKVVARNKKYYINEMGYDTFLRLDDYDFSGKTKEKLRYAANWLKRRNFQFVECSGDEIPIDKVHEVSLGWRGTRTVKRREVVFMNRPLVAEHEDDVRKFFLLDEAGKLISFAFFDPLYRDGDVIGYTTVIKRRLPEAPMYAETGLTKTAIETFKDEGKQLVTLGLAPLAGIQNKTFKANPFLAFSWKRGFEAKWLNRFFYNLKGHAQYKNHFYGEQTQTYFCSPDLFNDLRIIAMLKLMRVF